MSNHGDDNAERRDEGSAGGMMPGRVAGGQGVPPGGMMPGRAAGGQGVPPGGMMPGRAAGGQGVPPGGMMPGRVAGGMPGAMKGGIPRGKPPGIHVSGKTEYMKMLKWGWHIIHYAPGLFILTTVLVLLNQLLMQVDVKVLTGVMNVLQDIPLKGSVEKFLPHDKIQAAIVFLVVGVAIIAFGFLSRIVKTYTDTIMNRRLQQTLHDRLLTLGPSYHNTHDIGETMTVVTRFSTGAQMILTDLYSTPLIRIILFASGMYLINDAFSSMLVFPLVLKIGLLISLLAIPIVGWWLSSRLKEAYTLVRDSQIEVANEFTNSASLPVEVQLMGAQEQRSRSFGEKLVRYFRDQFNAAVKNEVASEFRASSVLLLQIMFVFSAAYYAVAYNDKAIVGVIVGNYLLIPMIVDPLQQVVEFINGLNRAWPQVESVIDILEQEPDVKEKPDAKKLEVKEPVVTLSGVSFRYVEGGAPVLDEVSHAFESGKVSAIVARAGGGKSTLLNLVARIRDPEKGTIRVGDTDIKDVTLISLRKNVAKVSQFPLFVADTIRINMQLAKQDACDEEIEAVCRKTGMWEVLERACAPGQKPLDYELPRAVSEGLSGGQRRLLAITRALLCKPSVLLMDEPTTGIDAIGRHMLITLLREMLSGMTVLLVDHDMEFVHSVANVVCCLEEGKFVDIGTPEELMGKPSLFQRLREAHDEELNEKRTQECPVE